jgi:hypothetical protein
MRSFLSILILSLACLKVWAAGPVTIDELQSLLASAHGESDENLAREIENSELTERLNLAQLQRLLAGLPGNRSREALLVLADASAFRDPPQSEIPPKEAPDLASQRQMISLAVNYVKKTRYELPNFYATRVTTSFRREIDLSSPKPLHLVGKYSDSEIYRNGQQLRKSRPHFRASGLTTSGEFGPILSTAILDASAGNLRWSHWEQGGTGPEAVFVYAVSAKESHYLVQDQVTAYNGEIAIDPSSGAILRIVFKAAPGPDNPLDVARIVVEYGPVELGGKSYICPLRGIAHSQGLQMKWLNDVAFKDYHLFRSEMRILSGFEEVR